MANLRWKLLTIVAVARRLRGGRRLPDRGGALRHHRRRGWLMDRQLKLGLDLKGGVHLVLRVQTDDALRVETEARDGAAARAARHAPASARRNLAVVSPPTSSRSRAFRPTRTRRSARRPTEVERQLRSRAPARNGTYTFTMKPNVQPTLREEAVVQARQTIERRVNELGVTEPSIAQQGADGDQILVQLPGVTDVNRAKEIIRSTGLLELKIVEQGPAASREALLVNGQAPPGMEVVPGASGVAGDAATTVYYLVRRVAAVTRPRPAERAAVARREQPAGRQLHAEHRRRRASSAGSPARTSAAQLAIVLDGRVQSAPTIDGRITSDGRISGSFTQEEVAEPVADPALGRAAGVADLPRGADDRPEPRRRLDSRPASSASLVGLLLIVVFMLVYYKLSGVNAIVALRVQPDHPARPDGLHRRGDDAARASPASC